MGRLRRVGERRLLPCRRCTDVERREPRLASALSLHPRQPPSSGVSPLSPTVFAQSANHRPVTPSFSEKAREVKDFNWASVGLDVVTAKTKYPEPKAQAS